MYQVIVQQIVNAMIIVMASILIVFTLLLLLLHFVTNAEHKRMQRIRQQILRLISPEVKIEYLKGQIYEIINGNAQKVTLRKIRGIRSQRGIQVLEIISRTVTEAQRELLLQAVGEEWFNSYLKKKVTGRNQDAALLASKLIAQLHVSGYLDKVEENLRRWPNSSSVQEISFFVLFMQGKQERLVRILSDSEFHLVLSFRTLQELFSCFPGDRTGLYRSLLTSAQDQYIKRACIHGIGLDGCTDLCDIAVPYLSSQNMNIQLETIRTLGKLNYASVSPQIVKLTQHNKWEVRCAAVDSLAQLDREHCYDAIFKCLCDKEWWVRFHAAEILVTLPCREKLLNDVQASADRYAAEMIQYMIERDAILKGGDAA